MNTNLVRLHTLLVAALLFVALVVTSSIATAQERPRPLKFLKDVNGEVTTMVDAEVTGEAAAKRDESLRTYLAGIIDYDDMAQRSLGKHWEPLTEEQRTEYKTLFRRVVELTYIDKLGAREKDARYEIEWDSERVKDDFGFGKAWVLYKDTETELDFTLKPRDDSWLLHDLAIDGASLEETYQRNYGKTIEEEGFDKLLDKMRERIAELEAE